MEMAMSISIYNPLYYRMTEGMIIQCINPLIIIVKIKTNPSIDREKKQIWFTNLLVMYKAISPIDKFPFLQKIFSNKFS